MPQVRQPAVFDAPPGADEGDGVAEGVDLGQHVAREQDRASALALLAHAVLEGRFHQRIEPRGGFVEHQQLDIGGQRSDEHHLLAIAL